MTIKQSASRYIEAVWWERESPPLILRLAEKIYAPISRSHLQKRVDAALPSPLPMISVGNITAGGSGKTPFVIWLAGQLIERGYKPVVICRGDGGNSEKPRIVDTDADAAIAGDEALLLAKSCPCPVISGRDRMTASHMAMQYGDIIILDDGLQYRQLKRVCDIVLIPAEGIGNGHLIPAGPLREPLSALKRADLIVRTGNTEAAPLTEVKEWKWSARSLPPVDIMGTNSPQPSAFSAVTAIARPGRFIHALHQLGLNIVEQNVFPDHHRFTNAEINSLAACSTPIITTAKDAVKIAPSWPTEQPLWVVHQQAEAEAGLLEAIISFLSTRRQA